MSFFDQNRSVQVGFGHRETYARRRFLLYVRKTIPYDTRSKTSGIFTYSQELVVEIPVESTSIIIEDQITNSNDGNYLFLADKNDIPVFNERKEDAYTRGSRRMKLFGTIVTYETDKSKGITEKITIPGPIDEVLRIKLHTTNTNRVYSWSYYRPKAEYNAKWVVRTWTQCSTSCGRGLQYRRVECIRETISTKQELVVEDQYCQTKVKPRESIRTCSLRECAAEWKIITEWSGCGATCGSGFVEVQTVACQVFRRANAHGRSPELLYDSLHDSYCSQRLKPSTSRNCNLERCPAVWTTGPWSECTVTEELKLVIGYHLEI